MEPSKQPFSKLLTIEGTSESYMIPKYQRPYSWGTDDWEQLLHDINEGSGQLGGHFMGSIICVALPANQPGQPRVYELVDGQQRLTTLSCLLLAIWSKLKTIYDARDSDEPLADLDDEDIEDLKSEMDDIRRKLIRERRYQKEESLPFPPTNGNEVNDFFIGRKSRTDHFLRILPSTQDSNRADFQFALTEYGALQGIDIPMPKNWGNRRFARCLKFFLNQLPADVSDLKALARDINALVFIHIDAASQSDAFQLFEAINNRGLPLSALDIIKNMILSSLERAERGSIDQAFRTWSNMTETLGPDTNIHESYLRHFYNAFQQPENLRITGFHKATKSTLIKIYEMLIKRDPAGLLDSLAIRAGFYAAITNPEEINLDSTRKTALVDLSRVEARPSHQFLLYLLDRESAGLCASQEVDRIISLIARFFARRNLTNLPATNRLDPLFIELIGVCEKSLEAKDSSITYDLVRKNLMSGPRADLPASDDEVREALRDQIYQENPKVARYLLCKLVESQATKEVQWDVWARDTRGRYVWTLEHVMPQTSGPDSEWLSSLSSNSSEALAIHKDHVHLLGNLTLSAYNSNLSDAPLSKKQAKTTINLAGSTVNIGYGNGLPLNTLPYSVNDNTYQVADTKEWNQHHILARSAAMTELILRRFKI